MKHPAWFILPVFGFGTAMMTAFYMFRLIYLTFYGKFRAGENTFQHTHESPKVMTVPLMILATLSVFIFYSPNPISDESGWFAKLLPTPEKVMHGSEIAEMGAASHAEAGAQSAHYIAMVISILVALTGIYIAYQTYYRWKISAAAWQKRLGVVTRGMQRKWWFDEMYNATFVALVLLISRILAAIDRYVIDGILDGSAKVTVLYSTIQRWFDEHIVDGLVNFTAWITDQFGGVARRFQTGRYQNYVWLTAAVVVVVLLWQLI
jgi:NADH-quinone oxidoreductase subunit L